MYLWMCISIILVVGAMILYICSEWDNIVSKVLGVILSIPIGTGIGLILGFIICLIVGFVSFLIPLENKVVNEYNISSIKDNMASNSSFVLGTGGSDEDIKIYYIKETENGNIIEKKDASSVIIVENDNVQPNVRTEGKRLPKWVDKWILPDLNFMIDKTTITVPEGTMITTYNVDLE